MHIWLVIFMWSFFFYDMIILFGGANRIALNALQIFREGQMQSTYIGVSETSDLVGQIAPSQYSSEYRVK